MAQETVHWAHRVGVTIFLNLRKRKNFTFTPPFDGFLLYNCGHHFLILKNMTTNKDQIKDAGVYIDPLSD